MNISEKSSIYYGVYRHARGDYRCEVIVSGKTFYVGHGHDQLLLAKMYDDFIIENKLDRRLNFPVYPENLIPNTKQIQLTKGKFAIVDESDFEWLNSFKWSAAGEVGHTYASRKCSTDDKTTSIKMHQLIMGECPIGMVIDHKNGDRFNNQRSNLRFCTTKENNRNRRNKCKRSSIYKGVSWCAPSNKWRVMISNDGKSIRTKMFVNEIDAARQYDIWCTELFGDFSSTNFK